ncbi:MAG: hypothetical protein IAG13_14865 [Deltaproteobacteria bacterium]|nr:hypothetical protein [Nannocystaceae bacterium]
MEDVSACRNLRGASAVRLAEMRTARSWSFVGSVSVLLACDVGNAIAGGASDVDAEAIEAATGVSESEADRFVGQYAFAGGEAQRTALRDAIEELVAQLGAVIRGVARDKLTKTNPVFGKLSIERKGGALVLTYDSLTNTCNLDGSASDVEGIDGSSLECKLGVQGDALVQRVDGSRGGRVNTFTIGKDGRLSMKTRVHSKLMPADLHYTLTFAR